MFMIGMNKNKINKEIVIILVLVILSLVIFLLFSSTKETRLSSSEVSPASFTGKVVSFDPQEEKLMIYENLRFRSRNISYSINSSCSENQRQSIRNGFDIMSNKTVLIFYELPQEAQISVNCNTNNPLEQLGEGGPNYIINATSYNVILNGNINLYGEEKCAAPITFLHELLHVFGFIHQNDNSSILYPTSSCSSNIPDSIINKINLIYFEEELPEILIKRIGPISSGSYFNFDIQLFNTVQRNFKSIYLALYKQGIKIDEYELKSLDSGQSKIVKIENIKGNNVNLTISADDEIYSIILV